MKYAYLCLFVAIASISCNSRKAQNGSVDSSDTTYFSEKISLKYLHGFDVSYHGSYALVDVKSPADTSKLLQRYVLIKRGAKAPDDLPEGCIVEVPLQRVGCFYSTTVSELNYLDVNSSISGVAETKYIKDSSVLAGIRNSKIVDLGEMYHPNLERIIQSKPEMLIISPVDGVPMAKIGEAGIPFLYDCSYLENTPLARAEWIKFLAMFYAKEKLANRIFDSVDARYSRVSSIANKVKYRPTVLSEKKYGQVWYLPGGKSYVAKLFADAGADYIWRDDSSTGSLALSFESVLNKASNADFWIVKTSTPFEYSYQHLENEYGLYRSFKAFQNRKVIVCDTGRTPYYEEGVLEPDVVLMDFVSHFHPELLPGYQPKYFKKL